MITDRREEHEAHDCLCFLPRATVRNMICSGIAQVNSESHWAVEAKNRVWGC